MMKGMRELKIVFIVWLMLLLTFMILVLFIAHVANAGIIIRVSNPNYTGGQILQVKEFRTAGNLFQRFLLMNLKSWAFYTFYVDEFGNIEDVKVFYQKKVQRRKNTG